MSKTRKKIESLGFTKTITSASSTSTNYLLKSGILSTNENKLFKEDDLSFSYFPDEVIHNNQIENNHDTFFHDERTIIFNEKPIAPTIRLETKYISTNSLLQVDFYNENKILKTPNIPNYHFTTSNVVNNSYLGHFRSDFQMKINTSDVYDRMLKEKHLKTETRAFSEKTNWTDDLTRSSANKYSNKKIISKEENYNTITIDYDLHKSPRPDLYLSFSKLQNTSQVTFPDSDATSYYTFNGNTAYFYNNDYTDANFGPFDYLGNVGENYKSSLNRFLIKSPICVSSISPYTAMSQVVLFPQLADSIKKTQWAGIPIDTFGFPYSNKFDAAPRHLIPASNYISKPFVIEKVCLEFNMSNWSVVKGTGPTAAVPCLNFVNFFILNQRGKINTNNLENTKTVKYYDNGNSFATVNNSYSGRTTYSTNNKSNNGTYTEQEINDLALASEDSFWEDQFEYLKFDKITGIDDKEKNTKNQQKDLITTVSIANYAYQADPDNNPLVNQEKIIDLVDLFVNESNNPLLGSGSVSECIYKDKKFKITSPVKHFFKNQKLPRLSSFHIYPEKIDSGRTNLNISSKRSLSGENLNNTGTKSFFSEGYNDIQINEFDFKESKYILNPEDSLVLGVTLSNGFVKSNDVVEAGLNIVDGDLVKISCSEDYPLKLHLIGYYLEDENKKVIVNKTTKQFKNTKRIGYYQNEVVDQIGSNLGYLDQNFYDRVGYAFAETNVYLNEYSSKNKTKLGNIFKNPKRPLGSSENSNIYNAINNDARGVPYINFTDEYYTYNFIKNGTPGSSVKFIEHFYSKYRFGMFSDKMNYNRIHQFVDSKYKNVKKRFMKGFYKQKTLGTVSAKLKFDFSKLNEFKGANYLVSEIMSGTDIKSNADYQLSFSIRDNLFQEVKLVYSNFIIASSDTHESEFYDLEGNIYTCINTTLKDKFNLTNGVYSSNEINKAKREFLQKIINGVNQINLKNQTDNSGSNPKDFKIGVTASIVESSMATDFPEIKITLNTKGSLNDAKIIFDDINSGVIIEDFALEEGDLLNSYNTTSNALYSDSDVAFKDS